MAGYVLGVDTGATKSHLALFNTDGRFVDFASWGPLNHELMPGSYRQFEEELERFVSGTLRANGIRMEQVAHAVLGVAGVDTKKQHGVVSQIISRIGLQNFTLCNDAYLGIPAGSPEGTGICAINGTGCTLAGINQTGGMMQIGGVGILSADMGGGAYLGGRAAAAAYSELFRKGEHTCMTPLLLEKLGIASKQDYIETIYEQMENGKFQLHACNQLVFEAVKQGDKIAADILREVASNYAGAIACMVEELPFLPDDPLTIVLAGSVFVKGEHPLLVDTLKQQVCANHPHHSIVFRLPDVPNVTGAVVWALRILGHEDGCYHMVCSQLQNAQHKSHPY